MDAPISAEEKIMSEVRPPVVMFFTGVAHPKTPMEPIRELLCTLFFPKGVDHDIHNVLPNRFGRKVWLAVCMPSDVLARKEGEVKGLLIKNGVFRVIRYSGPNELGFDYTHIQPQPFPWVEVEVIPAWPEVLAEVEKSKAKRPKV